MHLTAVDRHGSSSGTALVHTMERTSSTVLQLVGVVAQERDQLSAQIAALQSQVQSLEAQVAALGGARQVEEPSAMSAEPSASASAGAGGGAIAGATMAGSGAAEIGPVAIQAEAVTQPPAVRPTAFSLMADTTAAAAPTLKGKSCYDFFMRCV